jgi:hypothetical protein
VPWKVHWWSSKTDYDDLRLGSRVFMKYTLLFLVWAVITISFTIGMVLDVKLGLKVLGYGYAAFNPLGIIGIYPSFSKSFSAQNYDFLSPNVLLCFSSSNSLKKIRWKAYLSDTTNFSSCRPKIALRRTSKDLSHHSFSRLLVTLLLSFFSGWVVFYLLR